MLKIILAILEGFANAFRFFANRQQMDAGSDKQRARNAEEAVHDITIANEARDAARDAARDVRDTGELPDDGFRRD